jgi:3-deoxy-manno-octulosonate cytidylyltransferase (CMP-KDO synthetase)
MLNHPNIIGVIPARLDSQRLPGKVLLNIGSKAMVHWVYERARQSPLLGELLVATDSDKVHQYCEAHDIPVMMTRQHPSGSDRLYEVMERTDGDIYVNIQGDEPTIRADHIDLLLRPLITAACEVTTLKVAIDAVAAQNPNITKVVTDNRNRALYFSRHSIPYNRGGVKGVDTHLKEDTGKVGVQYYKHIGIYGYTRAALRIFHGLPQLPLELAEKLEQLRYLENGIPIYVAETPYDTVGVDAEADLALAAAMLRDGK